MKFTEKQLESMASSISATEEEKCKHAINMVRDALKEIDYLDDDNDIYLEHSDTLSYTINMRKKATDVRIKLLIQGSYANKTNISSESDVDIAVILESTFMSEYRPGITRESYGFSEGTFSASELKDDVERALKKHFGSIAVERHDKSIKVIGNTYRVDADVVPAYRHRDYSADYLLNASNCIKGIMIISDSGERIINYPEQHIVNGITKNKQTDYKYKKMVRIIKNMKELMKKNDITISPEISSFGLESLLWNVPESVFSKYSTLRYVFDEVLKHLLADAENFYKYTEANGIKPLFSNSPAISAYQRFIITLSAFFEYDI